MDLVPALLVVIMIAVALCVAALWFVVTTPEYRIKAEEDPLRGLSPDAKRVLGVRR